MVQCSGSYALEFCEGVCAAVCLLLLAPSLRHPAKQSVLFKLAASNIIIAWMESMESRALGAPLQIPQDLMISQMTLQEVSNEACRSWVDLTFCVHEVKAELEI